MLRRQVRGAMTPAQRPSAFGLYRHKKGGLYLALGVVQPSETAEPMVLYVGSAGWFVRPLAMFLDGRFRKLSLRREAQK